MDELFGCLIVVVIIGAILAGLYNYFLTNPQVFFTVAGVALFISILIKIAKTNKAARDKADKEKAEAEENARNLMNDKNKALDRVAEIEKKVALIITNFGPLMKRADKQIVTAQEELKDRVFIPFWDCIIAATRCFEDYQKNIRELAAQAKEHGKLLERINILIQGRNKVIEEAQNTNLNPSDKLDITEKSLLIPALPDPSELVRKMQALVREAHKDPDFANAYGHIKTHKGLENIGSEVREMNMSLYEAVSQLQSAVTNSLSDIEYRQDVDNFAIKEMLNNIQRRRKPND